jgi:hypothetical protein
MPRYTFKAQSKAGSCISSSLCIDQKGLLVDVFDIIAGSVIA